MKKKKAPNEARSRITTIGATMAGMGLLAFVLEECCAFAAELVEATTLAVPLLVVLVEMLAEMGELKDVVEEVAVVIIVGVAVDDGASMFEKLDVPEEARGPVSVAITGP